MSFCECDDPRPDEHDCCLSCGEEFASNRIKTLHLCNCADPYPDFSKGESNVPCHNCGKEDADVHKKQMDYLRKIRRWPNAPFRAAGHEVRWYVWLLYVVFCLPMIWLVGAINKANRWNSRVTGERVPIPSLKDAPKLERD